MKRIFSLSPVALLFLLMTCSIATAQQDEIPRTSSGLILQVTPYKGGRVTYHPVPGSNLFGYRKLPSWSTMDESMRALTIRLRYTLVNDAVRIDITVSHGKFRNDFTTAESYNAQEGKPVLLADLERFGVEPIQVMIVRLTPNVDMSAPLITSNAPSIEPVEVVLESPVLQTYIVSFRNNSKKTLYKMELKTFRGDTLASTGWPQGERSAVLAKPGEIFKYTAFASSSGTMTSDGLVPDKLTKLEIVTAIFDDDTYEGDEEDAVYAIANRRGQKMQLDRVIKLLEMAASQQDTDDITAEKKLLKQVDALPITSDQNSVNELLASHRSLFNNDAAGVKRDFESGLSGLKTQIVLDIVKFEQEKYNGSLDSFRKWLTDTKAQYQQWLATMK